MQYDIAILVNPEEKMPPSNERALKKFAEACKRNKVYCERITKKDFTKLNEFDGLFLRVTTALFNNTYKFAKAAEMEGIVCIDDADSIVKCTNKIYSPFHAVIIVIT